MTKYIALPDTWFDVGTEAELLFEVIPEATGLFRGIRDGKEDEEVCGYDEFKTDDGMSILT